MNFSYFSTESSKLGAKVKTPKLLKPKLSGTKPKLKPSFKTLLEHDFTNNEQHVETETATTNIYQIKTGHFLTHQIDA